MATKTITLDAEAYNRLEAAMRPDESFSSAIKRLVPEPRAATTRAELEALVRIDRL
jgi:predicted CopG family antitoxin